MLLYEVRTCSGNDSTQQPRLDLRRGPPAQPREKATSTSVQDITTVPFLCVMTPDLFSSFLLFNSLYYYCSFTTDNFTSYLFLFTYDSF